ncbi:MAG: hypothetical protein HY064_11065 [Bacteroidetes bacterium]|nr:hypothetical protein [Bacteroidota bacterium]
MKNISKILSIFFIMNFAVNLSAQSGTKWATNGNNISTADFFGAANSADINFRTNNIARMTITSAGTLRVYNLVGAGNGFVSLDVNGNLARTNFTNDTNQVLSGDGTFKNISSISGWAFSGNNIYNTNSGTVGIGTSSPSSGYLLDVNGDAHFSGNIFASGLVLTTKVQADTIRSLSQISINNNLVISAGTQNELYTNSNDLLIQSASAYTQGNTILNAGNSGKVGIGNLNPLYKLDVNGDERVSGKIYVERILGLPGDSIIKFGDSTLYLNYVNSKIFNSSSVKGMVVGSPFSNAFGSRSVAIGTNLQTASNADHAIVIGSGPLSSAGTLINNQPNSLMIGFNSTVPSFFVGPSASSNTSGNVGISTSIPESELQIGESYSKLNFGKAPLVASTFSSSYIGFNASRDQSGNWKSDGNGAGNGGFVLLNDIGGGLRFIGVPTSGGGTQNLTDQNMQDNTRMFLRADGRVIIGTKTQAGGPFDLATTLLTVNGGIVCQKANVTMNSWADSVLAPGYHLMPLDSVAKYIDSTGHLPGVASEKEVKANGVDLGQDDVMLMAKLEELTLYMLQLKKENEGMKKEIEELKLKNK